MSTQDGGGKGESGTERVGSRPSAELSFTCMLDEAEREEGEREEAGSCWLAFTLDFAIHRLFVFTHKHREFKFAAAQRISRCDLCR